MKTVPLKNTEQSRKGDYKMKKFLALISMITCIFGLTACSGDEQYTEFEQQKVDYAEQYAAQQIVPFMQNFMDDANVGIFDERTAEEIETIFEDSYSMLVDGYAVKSGIISFHSAVDEIGQIVSVGEAEAKIDDDQIIVLVQVEGEKKNAEAEIIVSNDMFMKLESAALNPISSMSELMVKAALNTLIGMGTVFVVLILIIFVISAFSFIPKIQEKFSKKEEKKETAPAPVQAAPVVEEVDESDDLELVAVIAAAIAAYEGAASTDGFVVRSIRKVNRSRR